MVVGHVTPQGLDERCVPLAGTAPGEIREPLGIVLTGDDGREHRPPALRQDVGEHARELDVGGLQDFVDALRVLSDLPDELLSSAGEVPQFLDPGRRHEAAADQPVGEQVRDPGRVVHVGLPTGDVPHVLRVGEDELELVLQQMPHRLPVDAGRLHRDMRAAEGLQPVRQLQQLAGGRPERAYLVRPRRRHTPHAGDDRVLVHVEPGKAGEENFPWRLRVLAAPGGALVIEVHGSRSAVRGPVAQSGVLAGLRVQLLNGLVAPRTNRPPSQRTTRSQVGSCTRRTGWRFIHRGGSRTRPMSNY